MHVHLWMKWNHQVSLMLFDLHMTVERFVSEEYESDEKYLRK